MCVYIAYDNLTISFGDKLGQHLTETLRISYGNRKVIIQLSCYLFKSHDVRTMTLRKSQGVGTLTVQLPFNFNGHPCSFLDTHLNCVSKSCDHKSCYEEASVLVEHGPKVWD